jgi:hypothetical protein
LNFKASAAETGICHGLKTIFLESTFHKLSTNDLLVYQKTVYEDIQGRLFHCVLLNFKASAAETGIFHGLETIFLESTFHKLSTNGLLVYQKTVYEDIQSRLFQVHKRKIRES